MNSEIWISGTDNPIARPARVSVLLVDEDPGELSFYQAMLRKNGFEVQIAASPEEGLRCLEKKHYDIIVLNQGSHAFEGRSVLARAIELDRRTPVLVLTKLVDMDCYLEAIQLGAVDYLEKPVQWTQLMRVMETHFQFRASAAQEQGKPLKRGNRAKSQEGDVTP